MEKIDKKENYTPSLNRRRHIFKEGDFLGGHLYFKGEAGCNDKGKRLIEAYCRYKDCTNTIFSKVYCITSGHTVSCGCYRKEQWAQMPMTNRKEIQRRK